MEFVSSVDAENDGGSRSPPAALATTSQARFRACGVWRDVRMKFGL